MYYALLTIQAISIVALFIESGYVFSKMNTKIHRYLFLNCIATLLNNTGYFLMMIANCEEQYLVALKMSYMGRVWIPFSLIVFVFEICKKPIKKPIVLGMVFFHVWIFFLVFTTQWHTLYYKSMVYENSGLWRHYNSKAGIFHDIYSLFLVAYIIIGMYLLITATVKERNPISRKRMSCLTMAIAVECAGFLIHLTGVAGYYDCTVLGYTIGTFFMYIAIFCYNLMDTMQLAKDYVADELTEAVLVVDQNDRMEYMNKPAAEIFAHCGNDLLKWIEEIEVSLEGGQPIEVEERIYTPHVKKLVQYGESRGKVYVLADDTEHYTYMQNLKEQKKIAEEANASKSAFLSVVSHEIRTPMNAVVGMTDLLLKDRESLNDKQEKYLKNIKNSGSALVMIINDILDQSKIEAGKMEIVEQPYELRSMTEDVKMIIENRIGSKPIHLIYEIKEEVPQFLVGDSLRIRQILINLMNNAVKFTEEGYIRLKIEVEEEEDNRKKLRFGIRDSGQGIQPEDLEKLGQAFTQVNTKLNHGKEGTGLGLSISRNFISLMGGQLEVTSDYGQGSEFYFSIWQKVADGVGQESASGVTKQAWQSEEEFTASGARVLVVDDNDINLMIMEELLEPVKMTVDTAHSGVEALELVRKNHYHTIFMDYMMPYMDGVEATEKIRNLARTEEGSEEDENAVYFRTVPIIALSGDTSDQTKEKFMRAGIDDFTEKPVELGRLKKLLLKWVQEELIDVEK